ncbi:hypothetical protein [Cupriavidus necator]|uniref:hypothetical protein n=1 Tax=Cupriavidus necator TaxID=106590 RepID=UPI0013DFB487|nr:hypothetical protein [Cupriavidus necator]
MLLSYYLRHCIEARIALVVSSCFLLLCNEVRLLSRRIIIRLHDDVKKKVQKNLPACIAPARSHAQCHEDVADDIETHRSHAGADTRFARSRTLRDTPSHTPRSQLLHTAARAGDRQRDARPKRAQNFHAHHHTFRKAAWTKALRAMH